MYIHINVHAKGKAKRISEMGRDETREFRTWREHTRARRARRWAVVEWRKLKKGKNGERPSERRI